MISLKKFSLSTILLAAALGNAYLLNKIGKRVAASLAETS